MTITDTGPKLVITNRDGDHLPLSKNQMEEIITYLIKESNSGKEFRKVVLVHDS